MQQTPPPAPPTPPPLASSNDLTASKFAQQNASLLSQVREQNQQMKDLREERDQLLDHVSSIGAKHATFQAMTEDNIKLGLEVDQLKNLLKQKEDELVVELRKKDKDFLTVSDDNIALKNENERLKTFKNQLFVGIKDRDTKIENLENAFTDLREKYYEMIQEVETSKALALAIKQVAAEGATIAHSTNIKRKQELGNKTSTLPSPPPQVQNLPNMNQIHLLNRRQQNINNRQMTTQQHQYQQHQEQYAMYSNNDSFNYNNNNNNNNNYNNSPPPQSSSSYLSFQNQHGNDRFDSNQSFASSMADRYMNHKQRSPRQHQQLRNEFIEEYDDEIISGMDKKELQILRRKSQIAKQKVMLGNNNNRNNGNNNSPTYSNSSSSQTSPKLAIRHTNGSYNRKNKSRTKKNAKAGRNKNIAFGKTNQRIGRASWIVHKDANYFINNSSVESRQWREFNTNSPDNTSSNGM